MRMKGILILAHGSKQKETEDTLYAVISALRRELSETDGKAGGEIGGKTGSEIVEKADGTIEIEAAFLQFSDRDLNAGLKALVDKGVDDVIVVPYFLFDGTHIKEDIPGEIEAFTKLYPNIRVRLGKTLGADKRLALILKDRIAEMI